MPGVINTINKESAVNRLRLACLVVALSFGSFGAAAAQDRFVSGGRIVVPDSSVERPVARGLQAHTDVELFYPINGLPLTAANTPR
jgi:hypothetical protein